MVLKHLKTEIRSFTWNVKRSPLHCSEYCILWCPHKSNKLKIGESENVIEDITEVASTNIQAPGSIWRYYPFTSGSASDNSKQISEGTSRTICAPKRRVMPASNKRDIRWKSERGGRRCFQSHISPWFNLQNDLGLVITQIMFPQSKSEIGYPCQL